MDATEGILTPENIVAKRPAVRCRFCAAYPLYWTGPGDDRFLADRKGNRHTCLTEQYRKIAEETYHKSAIAEEFD